MNKAFTEVCILFFDVSKNIQVYGVSVIRFALQKPVHVDTRFSTDTDESCCRLLRTLNKQLYVE